MSCIAVKVTDKEIQFAADSIMLRGDMIVSTPKSPHKLFTVNDMIIGSSGYYNETSLMEMFAQTHKPRDNSSYALREFLIEFCEWKQKKGEQFASQNEYLIAFEGKCFVSIYGDIEEVKDFCAVGAGMAYAFAALYLGHSPEEAVEVACKLSAKVCEPIIGLAMKRTKNE